MPLARRHHRHIADAVPGLPLFLFQASHAASRAGPPARRGRQQGGRLGGNRYDALRRQAAVRQPGVAVLAGGDEHLLACMAHGSDGSTVLLAGIVPAEIVALGAGAHPMRDRAAAANSGLSRGVGQPSRTASRSSRMAPAGSIRPQREGR